MSPLPAPPHGQDRRRQLAAVLVACLALGGAVVAGVLLFGGGAPVGLDCHYVGCDDVVVCLDEPVTLSRVDHATGACTCLPAEGDPHLDEGQMALTSEAEDGSCHVILGSIPGAVLVAIGLPLDVNRATAEELEAVPGIGPALAEAIVTHREVEGPFADVAALEAVPGIGPATLETIAPYLEAKE